MEKHITKITKLETIQVHEPEYGDFKLNMCPVENNGHIVSLPDGFKCWNDNVNNILKHVPILQNGDNRHFVTIDSKFFSTDGFLRREGVHADGNFCVDPDFKSVVCWGGSQPKPTWGGSSLNKKWKVEKDWETPFDVEVPIGTYITEKKGGIFCVSSEVGCQAWEGEFHGEVKAEGDYTEMNKQLTDDKRVVFNKNKLYFMTSNTPHETLHISKGTRRTFVRVSLNHDYPTNMVA